MPKAKQKDGLSMTDVWTALEFVTNKVVGEQKSKRIAKAAEKCWEGEEQLYLVFWLYGFLGSIIVSVISMFILTLFGAVGMLLSFVLIMPYMVWVLYSIWQCSENIEAEEIMGLKREHITLAAKAVALLAALKYFLTFGW